MSEITDITIKNIKGYGSPAITLPITLKTNRINLIFAPNGTGKSSFAIAFCSLNGKRLDVKKDNKYHKDETLDSSITLKMDGHLYEANALVNTITPVLKCHIINCATVVHTTQNNMGRFTNVSGYIDIENIIIEPIIPVIKTGYSITQIKSEFGVNGKILDNLSNDFDDNNFLLKLRNIIDDLNTFGTAKSRVQLVEDVLSQIRNLKGTATEVIPKIDENWLANIEQNDCYAIISSFLSECFPSDSRVQRFLRFYQLYIHWTHNKKAIKAAIARAEYDERKMEFDRNLALLDTTWKNIHTEEVRGNLVVNFPSADEISNGQRDLLTFIVQIIKFKTQLHDNKKYLLIIDEIFDYLDDANIIAAQYFLTKFLNISKDNFFLCLLSHLNPFTFRSYVFSASKLNPQYLKDTVPSATLPMMDFISFRERLKEEGKSEEVKSCLYHKLSHDLFHYNPEDADYSTDIALYKTEAHLNEQWGRKSELHRALIDEVNKYLSGISVYDPYAVALALRLRVEKIMYERLPNELQQGFINEKMTRNKFEYCQQNSIEVEDVLYIVSAIHNEADHLKFDAINNRYIEKPMVYKLQNNVITEIMKKIFNWEGSPLSASIID